MIPPSHRIVHSSEDSKGGDSIYGGVAFKLTGTAASMFQDWPKEWFFAAARCHNADIMLAQLLEKTDEWLPGTPTLRLSFGSCFQVRNALFGLLGSTPAFPSCLTASMILLPLLFLLPLQFHVMIYSTELRTMLSSYF